MKNPQCLGVFCLLFFPPGSWYWNSPSTPETAPPPRTRHGAVYDDVNDLMLATCQDLFRWLSCQYWGSHGLQLLLEMNPARRILEEAYISQYYSQGYCEGHETDGKPRLMQKLNLRDCKWRDCPHSITYSAGYY